MAVNDSSILDDVKTTLGLPSDYTPFDSEVLIHINSVFSTLHQLGLGPEDGFVIEDKTSQWSSFMNTDKRLSAVKSYIYLRVRLLFDPPPQESVLRAMTAQVEQSEWRLTVAKEEITLAL